MTAAGEAALRALGAPMSRRDMWLTIALAVARDGMPEPNAQRHSESGVYLDFDTQQQVERWTAYLDLTPDAAVDRAKHDVDYKGARWIVGAHGWPELLDKTHVRISACVEHLDAVAEPSPLAEQVVAAIAPSGVDGYSIGGRS